jgi:nitrogen-specific signal transduction histidine kinase
MPEDHPPGQDKYLPLANRKTTAPASEGKILDRAVHELQNYLQSIGMALDLLQLTHPDDVESQTIMQGIERASRLLRELREYFCPPDPYLSTQSLVAVVTDVIQQREEEWRRQQVRVRLVCHDPLPAVRLDWQQARSALERMLAFARALLPEGGELEVAARLRKIGGQWCVEFKVTSSANTPLAIEAKDVFQPFLRVHTYQTGLSLVLVRQMVQRQHGHIAFRKLSPRQGRFTMLLRAHAV